MDLISVIVPVYKVEKYLDRCVQSIVDQTYRNLEIILVDDGSPDNCGTMCDTWAEKDSRIKVIHKENGGLSDARNAGMAAATGEYIAFVDSDDWVRPEYIMLMYQALKQCGVSLVACDYLMTDGESIEDFFVEPRIERHRAAQALEMASNNKGYRSVVWNKLYHHSLLEGEKFPLGRYHEDEFFTYRIMDRAGEMAYLNAPLYFYFQHAGSIMQSVSIKHLDFLDAMLERQTLLRDKYPELYWEGKVQLCNACVNYYAEALKARPDNFAAYDKKIRECRKQVRITVAEFRKLSLARKIYVLGGRIPYVFCSALIFVREIRNG